MGLSATGAGAAIAGRIEKIGKTMGCCNSVVIGKDNSKNVNIRLDRESNSLIFTNSDGIDTIIPLALMSGIEVVNANPMGLRLVARQGLRPMYGDTPGGVLPLHEGVTTLEDNGVQFTYTNEEGQRVTVRYGAKAIVGVEFLNGASRFAKTLRLTFQDGTFVESDVQIASATRTSELVNDGDGTGDRYVQSRDLAGLTRGVAAIDSCLERVEYRVLTSHPSGSAVGSLSVRRKDGATEEFPVMESKTGFDFTGATVVYHGEDRDNIYPKEQFTDYKRTEVLEETCRQLAARVEDLRGAGMTEAGVRAIVKNVLIEHGLI